MTDVNKTTAETQSPNNWPGFTNQGEAVGIGGVFAALLWGILQLRRRASRDGTEIIKDRAEGKLVETLLKERDDAKTSERTAWTRANELAVINARQEQKILYQAEEIARLNRMIEEMQVKLDEIKQSLQHLSSGATVERDLPPRM